ncbi:mitochondrial carrier family [Dunaliella salina]|uniref:Mitochondrial carrier family n=2 Tax=Dunaliella salina TaxID=3046 RepID=A0ABQ7GYM6_DUNSA|nr:mitochondrial carrier family [Dunaliella salina]|eukprot:KAF5839700.1 mitochondrial carrier family [Dunaliella salina]
MDPHAPASERSSILSTLAPFIAGPIAGVCSRIVIYPSDTIKARLQVQGSLGRSESQLYRSTRDAASQMLRQEGFKAFYRGFGVVVVGNVPANMAYFGGYELGKWLLPDRSGLLSNMATGAIAQLSGGLLFTPVDIIKERMQVQGLLQGHFSYTGSWHALTSLLKDRGPLGLFRGYWATNAVWIPWSVLHIAAYEKFKGWAADAYPGKQGLHRSPDDLPPWVLGGCSAASASLAALVTQPMDVVKTRLQVRKP